MTYIQMMRLENELRKKDEELEALTAQYQGVKIELEDLSGELEYTKQQLQAVQEKALVREEDLRYTNQSLREAMEKLSSQEADVRRLESLLANADTDKNELASAARETAALRDHLAARDKDMIKLVIIQFSY